MVYLVPKFVLLDAAERIHVSESQLDVLFFGLGSFDAVGFGCLALASLVLPVL